MRAETKQLIDVLLPIVADTIKGAVSEARREILESIDIEKIASDAAALIPAPENGKDGVNGRDGVDGKDGEPGPQGEKGEKGETGDCGEAGPAGESVSREAVAEMVKAEIEAIEIVVPEAKDGRDGKDALDIQVLPHINTDKSYPKGVFASHKGGLWLSREQTDGMEGWECIVRGESSHDVVRVDDRTIAYISEDCMGRQKRVEVPVAGIRYEGIWSEDKQYGLNDSVTFGGSLWIAKTASPDGKPGQSDDWQLAVKKGRDGKDA